SPGFTAVSVLTLALGLGGATAIFSAVNPILFRSLPYPDAARVMMVWEVTRQGSRSEGTFGMYRELAARARAFQAVAALRSWQPTVTGGEQPERLEGQRVSASYFSVLGVAPALGRGFQPTEDQANGPNVAVLSHALWQRRFGGDPGILGRAVTLDDTGYTVIGVLPSTFDNVVAPSAEIWTTLQYDMTQGRAWGHHLRTVARLRSGVTVEQAAAELNAIGAAVLNELRPETYGSEIAFRVTSLQDDVTRSVKPALLAILGAVALVLVIACVNVTNLLLARDARRKSEYALRAALGAGAGRLVRYALAESLVIAALGGAAGLVVADLGARAFTALSPADLPRASAIGVDGVVFGFSLAVATLVGLACGLIPAFAAARSDPHAALQQSDRRAVGGHGRARGVLVIAEVALALVLLVGSGLLLRSLQRLFAVEPGFDASQVITFQVQTGPRLAADGTTSRFFEQALDAARRVPGVAAAGLTSQLPLSGDVDLFGVQFDPPLPDDPGEPSEVRGTFRYAVSPGYFETMRIPLRRGRLLEEADRPGAPLVAVISESLARRRLQGRDPIGRRLRIGAGPLYTVVGVVGDVRQMSLAMSESDAVYVTAGQWRFADNVMSLVVRAPEGASALATPLREAVWSVDRNQPIVRVATMEDLMAASAAERRFALMVFQVFALAALALAAAGISGVLMGSVAERTREIGVRAALGASQYGIVALVLRQGMMLTGLGLALGLAGAALVTPAMTALLYGVTALDWVTYGAALALLAAVAVIACAAPAWRAARV
ncbi:MAG TPA: ABC transporter permease, partial [Gemmatimonadales bacterium]|nr:ABC transporter permease [Gemmatimonadales bacterium]